MQCNMTAINFLLNLGPFKGPLTNSWIQYVAKEVSEILLPVTNVSLHAEKKCDLLLNQAFLDEFQLKPKLETCFCQKLRIF